MQCWLNPWGVLWLLFIWKLLNTVWRVLTAGSGLRPSTHPRHRCGWCTRCSRLGICSGCERLARDASQLQHQFFAKRSNEDRTHDVTLLDGKRWSQTAQPAELSKSQKYTKPNIAAVDWVERSDGSWKQHMTWAKKFPHDMGQKKVCSLGILHQPRNNQYLAVSAIFCGFSEVPLVFLSVWNQMVLWRGGCAAAWRELTNWHAREWDTARCVDSPP